MSDGGGIRPRARRKRLVVRRLAEETLVYDLDTHRAHCLNRMADAVWRLCDGRRTLSDIARALKEAPVTPADPGVLRLALRQLRDAGLLVETGGDAELREAPSRRELLVRLGAGAAALLPVVASVVAPTPAQAASPVCAGGPTDSTQCKDLDDPNAIGCCCADKGKICVDTGGGNLDCKGANC